MSPGTRRLEWTWPCSAGLFQARLAGARMARTISRSHGPGYPGAPGKGRLLGYRDQAGAGSGSTKAIRSSRARFRPMCRYLACARYLLARRDVFYPQFATHNAHTLAAVRGHGGRGSVATNSSACTAWASSLYEAWSRMPRCASLPHLCAGRKSRGPARLSGAPPARERRQ